MNILTINKWRIHQLLFVWLYKLYQSNCPPKHPVGASCSESLRSLQVSSGAQERMTTVSRTYMTAGICKLNTNHSL